MPPPPSPWTWIWSLCSLDTELWSENIKLRYCNTWKIIRVSENMVVAGYTLKHRRRGTSWNIWVGILGPESLRSSLCMKSSTTASAHEKWPECNWALYNSKCHGNNRDVILCCLPPKVLHESQVCAKCLLFLGLEGFNFLPIEVSEDPHTGVFSVSSGFFQSSWLTVISPEARIYASFKIYKWFQNLLTRKMLLKSRRNRVVLGVAGWLGLEGSSVL